MIIRDRRTLGSVARKTGINFNSVFGYCDDTKDDYEMNKLLEPLGYKLKYFDGCFYPYLVKKDARR
jgi:hypothetical protein